jgi:hypothetical protein
LNVCHNGFCGIAEAIKKVNPAGTFDGRSFILIKSKAGKELFLHVGFPSRSKTGLLRRIKASAPGVNISGSVAIILPAVTGFSCAPAGFSTDLKKIYL